MIEATQFETDGSFISISEVNGVYSKIVFSVTDEKEISAHECADIFVRAIAKYLNSKTDASDGNINGDEVTWILTLENPYLIIYGSLRRERIYIQNQDAALLGVIDFHESDAERWRQIFSKYV